MVDAILAYFLLVIQSSVAFLFWNQDYIIKIGFGLHNFLETLKFGKTLYLT